MIYEMLITSESLLDWLNSYSHVLEYSADLKRAYIEDEDDEGRRRYISVALVRQLLADGQIAVWRSIGQWNRGYDTYKPTQWIEAWKQQHSVEVSK